MNLKRKKWIGIFKDNKKEFEQYLKAEENYDTAIKYGRETNSNI
jgi:hypothetical protein